LAGTKTADGRAVLHHVRHDIDFGVALDETTSVLLNGSEFQASEETAEGDELKVGKVLIAEQQPLMCEPGAIHGSERPIVNRAQIPTPDLGTERGTCRDYGHGAHIPA